MRLFMLVRLPSGPWAVPVFRELPLWLAAELIPIGPTDAEELVEGKLHAVAATHRDICCPKKELTPAVAIKQALNANGRCIPTARQVGLDHHEATTNYLCLQFRPGHRLLVTLCLILPDKARLFLVSLSTCHRRRARPMNEYDGSERRDAREMNPKDQIYRKTTIPLKMGHDEFQRCTALQRVGPNSQHLRVMQGRPE
jgi:hypothetical protein